MSDVLKKPVHVALIKPTQLEKLAAQKKISQTPFGLDPGPVRAPLPMEESKRPSLKIPTSDLVKKNKAQIKLRVIHDSTPAIPPDKQPDCNSCKTAACCRAYVVNITELEYESGLYGDAAIKLTPEIYEQLQNKRLRYAMAGAPHIGDKTAYYLEGKLGDACPFLQDDNRCGIYDIRPTTCRTYTCVGDPRITQAMRDGTDPINVFTLTKNKKERDAS